MKIIKSNSVNFSKSCNFGLQTEYQQPSEEEIRENAINLVNQGREDRAEAEAEHQAELEAQAERDAAKVEGVRDEIYQIEPNLNRKVAQAREAEAQARAQEPKTVGESWLEQKSNQEKIDEIQNTINKANETKASLKDRIAQSKQEPSKTEELKKDIQQEELASIAQDNDERSKIGKVADEVASTATKGAKGIANAVGSLLGKFDKTKELGQKVQDKANDVGENVVGKEVGDWADQHKVAAGAIGAGALLGAGYLGKKAYDLAKNKKQLQADAYYAFADGNITKEGLIGGPYATRKDAREAKPEAVHILKGSTLGAYGDFEVAS